MNKRRWVLGSDTVEELYEYKNLGVLRKYVDSFSSNVVDNIEKTQKKWECYFRLILTEGNWTLLYSSILETSLSTIFAVWLWTFHGHRNSITETGALSNVIFKNKYFF